jgi:hypothetical protein
LGAKEQLAKARVAEIRQVERRVLRTLFRLDADKLALG